MWCSCSCPIDSTTIYMACVTVNPLLTVRSGRSERVPKGGYGDFFKSEWRAAGHTITQDTYWGVPKHPTLLSNSHVGSHTTVITVSAFRLRMRRERHMQHHSLQHHRASAFSHRASAFSTKRWSTALSASLSRSCASRSSICASLVTSSAVRQRSSAASCSLIQCCIIFLFCGRCLRVSLLELLRHALYHLESLRLYVFRPLQR